VIGKARIWRFDASGAGKVGVGAADGKDSCGITAGVKPKGGKDALSPKGEIGFTGMAFYYMLYLEVGVGGGESKKQEDADEGDDPKVTVKKPKSTTRLYEKSGTVVLMKPWTWPKEAGGGEG
jgi:hypothetical protein